MTDVMTTLAHILEQIKTLQPEELRQVQRVVEDRLASGGYSPEEERFHQALLASGLVKEIKSRRTTPLAEPPLIHVEGKPVSETIIEERR